MFYESAQLNINSDSLTDEFSENTITNSKYTPNLELSENSYTKDLPIIDIQNVINALTSTSNVSMQTETNSESLSNNMIGGYNDNNNDTESIIDLSSILNGLSIDTSSEEQTGGYKRHRNPRKTSHSKSRRRKRRSSSRSSRRRKRRSSKLSRRRRRRKSSRKSSSSSSHSHSRRRRKSKRRSSSRRKSKRRSSSRRKSKRRSRRQR